MAQEELFSHKSLWRMNLCHLLSLFYPIFTCVDPDPYSQYGSTKHLNMDPIRVRIHNTALSRFNRMYIRLFLLQIAGIFLAHLFVHWSVIRYIDGNISVSDLIRIAWRLKKCFDVIWKGLGLHEGLEVKLRCLEVILRCLEVISEVVWRLFKRSGG